MEFEPGWLNKELNAAIEEVCKWPVSWRRGISKKTLRSWKQPSPTSAQGDGG